MRTNDYLAFQDELNALEMQTPKQKWTEKLKSHPQFNDLVKDHGESYINGIIDQIFLKKPDTKSKTPELALNYLQTWISRDYSKNPPVQQPSKPAKKYTDDNDRLAQQVLSHWMSGGMLKTIGLKNEHVYYALAKFKKHLKENDIDTGLLDPVVLNLPKMFPYEHLGCNTEQVFDLLVSALEKFSAVNQ